MRKIVALIILLALAVPVFSVSGDGGINGQTPSRLMTLQAPLRMDNDSAFYNTSVSMGWEGDGSPSDPFMIQNYEVGDPGFSCGIYVGNVTYSFIIRNCWVHNLSSSFSFYYWGAGIALFNVRDARVEDCHVSDTGTGIVIGRAFTVTVNDTSIERTQYEGINGFRSESLVVVNNIIRYCASGIDISSSNMVMIQDNDLAYGETTGVSVHSGVSACNITGNIVHGYSYIGVHIGNSDGCRITSNRISDSDTGVHIDGKLIDRSADRNIIRGNTIVRCDIGIDTQSSMWTVIDGNNVSFCYGNGIELDLFTENETVRNNMLWYNAGYGVYLGGGGHLVHNNTFHYNNKSTNVHDPFNVQGYDGSMSSNWSLDGRGNIWSDWRGPDDNEDGIVDLPYMLHGPPTHMVSDPCPISDYIPPQLFPPSEPTSFRIESGRLFANLSWGAPSDDGGSPITGYTVYRSQGGSNPLVIADMTGNDGWYNDTNVLENTTYSYRISASNDIGEGPLTTSLEITTPVPLGVPSIEIVHPAQETTLRIDHVTIRWIFSVANGTLDHIEIDTGYGWIDVGNSTQYRLGPLADGIYHIPVRILTTEGPVAQYDLTFNVSVPSPYVQITSPNLTLLNDDPVEFTWSTGSEGSTIDMVEYRLDDGSWTDAGMNTSLTLWDLNEGVHVFSVRVADAAGRNTTDTLTLTVDRTPPNVLDYGPVELDVQPGAIVYASFGEMVVNNSVSIRMEPEVSGNLSVRDNSFVQFLPDAPLISGTTYIVHIQALDAAGNLLFPFSWSFRVEERIISTKVFGYVTDVDGTHLQDAVVTLDNLSMKTNAFGEFEFLVPPGSYQLSVYKEGYIEHSMTFMVSSTGEYNIGLVSLEPTSGAEDDPDEDGSIPWIPVLIFIFAGVVAIGYFTLKQQSKSGEFDVEE